VHKYVLSTTLQDPEWQPTTILRALDELRALREQPGRLGVTGSVSVAQQLADADLIDEYRFFVSPVLVRDGPRILAGGKHVRLDLVEATAFPSGVTLLRYQHR
jgi:dihydrofolate reductase